VKPLALLPTKGGVLAGQYRWLTDCPFDAFWRNGSVEASDMCQEVRLRYDVAGRQGVREPAKFESLSHCSLTLNAAEPTQAQQSIAAANRRRSRSQAKDVGGVPLAPNSVSIFAALFPERAPSSFLPAHNGGS
jgi:hypothetical protein